MMRCIHVRPSTAEADRPSSKSPVDGYRQTDRPTERLGKCLIFQNPVRFFRSPTVGKISGKLDCTVNKSGRRQPNGSSAPACVKYISSSITSRMLGFRFRFWWCSCRSASIDAAYMAPSLDKRGAAECLPYGGEVR